MKHRAFLYYRLLENALVIIVGFCQVQYFARQLTDGSPESGDKLLMNLTLFDHFCDDLARHRALVKLSDLTDDASSQLSTILHV